MTREKTSRATARLRQRMTSFLERPSAVRRTQPARGDAGRRPGGGPAPFPLILGKGSLSVHGFTEYLRLDNLTSLEMIQVSRKTPRWLLRCLLYLLGFGAGGFAIV